MSPDFTPRGDNGYWALVPTFRYGTMSFGPYVWRHITHSPGSNGANMLTWTQA